MNIKTQNTYAKTGENRQADSVVSDTYSLLISDFISSTRGERHNSYYADPINGRRILGCLRSLSVGIRKTQLHLQRPKSNSMPQWQKLNFLPPWSNLNFQLTLFKILRFSGPSLPGMTSSTLQSHFLSGVYYDNGDCHILCARA